MRSHEEGVGSSKEKGSASKEKGSVPNGAKISPRCPVRGKCFDGGSPAFGCGVGLVTGMASDDA